MLQLEFAIQELFALLDYQPALVLNLLCYTRMRPKGRFCSSNHAEM